MDITEAKGIIKRRIGDCPDWMIKEKIKCLNKLNTLDEKQFDLLMALYAIENIKQ